MWGAHPQQQHQQHRKRHKQELQSLPEQREQQEQPIPANTPQTSHRSELPENEQILQNLKAENIRLRKMLDKINHEMDDQDDEDEYPAKRARTIERASELLPSFVVRIAADASNECIVLTNLSDARVFIGNWRLHTKRGNEDFRIPPGTSIPGAACLTVWSGPEADKCPNDNLHLRWTSRPMLSSPNESVYLFDGTGRKTQITSVVNQTTREHTHTAIE
eukprot:c2481_g1_i1.p1 GENE.c2481_g1_i1~~c2481_g1_i1.p1  ORF type:complete len:241 (+),score=37.79 c2481_g1_i1:69-725(+)